MRTTKNIIKSAKSWLLSRFFIYGIFYSEPQTPITLLREWCLAIGVRSFEFNIMSILKAKALICQGGGPTAVINQSLVGVVLALRQYPQIEKIYGASHAGRGVINEELFDLTEINTQSLEQVAQTPGAALGSCRDKPDTEYCAKMFAIMKKHGIGYFFWIGGNDGASVCDIVNREAEKASYELRVMHVPKTVDNDILINDHTPGFGSAAKFVAQAFAGVNCDNRALPGVYIGVVMGRHAGFLTGASVLAKKYADDGPHLIYLPERPFSPEQFIVDVQEVYDKYGRCIVAVSEGIADEQGNPIVADLMKNKEFDPHGNVQLSGSGALGDLLADLIKEKTKIKRVRADTLGYLQRSFLGCVSETDKKEARAVGEKAVEFAISHNVDGSVIIKRAGDYAVSYELVPLSQVACGTKSMPAEFILGNNFVTEEFKNYLRPLVGELPIAERLEAPIVGKIT